RSQGPPTISAPRIAFIRDCFVPARLECSRTGGLGFCLLSRGCGILDCSRFREDPESGPDCPFLLLRCKRLYPPTFRGLCHHRGGAGGSDWTCVGGLLR